MKLGWLAMAGEPDAVAEARGRLELIADAWLSVGTPVQLAAPALLSAAAVTRDAIHQRVTENLAWLRAQLPDDSPITVPPLEGGWYAPLRLPASLDDEAWCEKLLHDDHVVVHPGSFYDFPAGTWIVVSLLAPAGTFREGAARLLARVHQET